MIFKFPTLKGYVKFQDGKITSHNSDPENIYMRKLKELAENWERAYEEAEEPVFQYLSYEAQKIVKQVRHKKNEVAINAFSERVEKMIKHDRLKREYGIEKWAKWLRYQVGDEPNTEHILEAAEYFWEQQYFKILNEEV